MPLRFIRLLNPTTPFLRIINPIVRNPIQSFSLIGKPVAEASSALMQRNSETITVALDTEDYEGTATIDVPYDQDTLEKMLAVSLLPQVMMLSKLYSIPEIALDLNNLWRAATLGKFGASPVQASLRGQRAANVLRAWTPFVKQANVRLPMAIQSGRYSSSVIARLGGQSAARAGGSFVPGLNIAIWVDTAILATSGLLDYLIDEETEDDLGIDLQLWSPLGSVINAMIGATASALGVEADDILEVASATGLDDLAKKTPLVIFATLLDFEAATFQADIQFKNDMDFDLDLDPNTLGAVLAEALKLELLDRSNFNYTSKSFMVEVFILVVLSFLLITFVWRGIDYLRK